MWAADSTTLEHVRLKHSQLEPPVARLRLSYLLSAMEFRPFSMPPAALLIVRSMPDPLPGRIAKKLEAGTTVSGQWERAARSQIAHLYRNAARPATDDVAPSSQAVVFADWGELLACCARDVVRGRTNVWWWRSAARRFSLRITESVADVWHDYPRYVPAALQLLSTWGEAASIVECIPAPRAWRLLLAILRDSGLFRLANVVSECVQQQTAGPQFDGGLLSDPSSQLGEHSITSQESGFGTNSVGASAEGFHACQAPAPWEPDVPSHVAPASLGPAVRTLLGISLLLQRNLKHASAATFPLCLRSWLIHAIAQERAAVHENSQPAANAPLSPFRTGLANRLDQHKQAANTCGTGISLTGFAEASAKIQAETARPQESPGAEPPEKRVEGMAEAVPTTAVALENGEPTGAAGVFYLIHFLRESELFGLEVGFGGWALLELLARCLLDSAWNDVSEDAIWSALALLDGREPGTSPISHFQPQITYEAPGSWLRGLDSSTQFVRFRSDRVETWHGEGFLTLDSTSPEKPAGCALRPVTRIQKRAWRRAASIRATGLPRSRELRRFLHFILPYARWRLGLALRSPNLEEVLLRRGMLYVTRTHIDVVMSLSQIHLGARLAGFDSNPGWVTELGRVINFHFDEDLNRG